MRLNNWSIAASFDTALMVGYVLCPYAQVRTLLFPAFLSFGSVSVAK
jgi:hypothetical protein